MFRASSAHLQEVSDVNGTCMQPLVFSFCKILCNLYKKLCIKLVSIKEFPVLFVCTCVLNCHRVATQLQLN